MISENSFKNTLDYSILNICDNEYKYFFNKSNVVGVALGYKITNGFYTNKKCIQVFVSKKVSCNKLCNFSIIPKKYKDLPTDVIETGVITPGGLTSKIRPAIGGYSIGCSNDDTTGTLGCLVTDGHTKYVLSNNHVIALINKAILGTPLLQPGKFDGGKSPSDIIAYLTRYIPLAFKTALRSPTNFVDCAIGSIANDNVVSSSIAYIGKIKGKKSPTLNEPVQKIGRTTQRTFGNITNIGATLLIRYDSNQAVFKKQVVTNLMTGKGDSGALLLDTKGYVIGLYFADSTSRSYFNSIESVLSHLNVQLVTT